MDVGALGRRSESDRVRMINVLLSGFVSSADMDSLVRLWSAWLLDSAGVYHRNIPARLQNARIRV
jgi:hypothetical protein